MGWSKAEEEEDEEDEAAAAAKRASYTILGTAADAAAVPACVSEVVAPDAVAAALLGADAAVYHCWDSEAQAEQAAWAAGMLLEAEATFAAPKVLVCVAPCLTWAKTKPADPDDPELPLTEEDYRRRKAHANYKVHIAAEKAIIKAGKQEGSKLATYVVNSGLPYGRGEGPLHWLFKTAWLLAEPKLPFFGPGQNVLPLIHVADLAQAVVNVLERQPEQKYVLAVDESQHTFEELATTISERLGSGAVAQVSKADGLLLKGLSQADYDALSVNLRFEPTTIKEFRIDWTAQAGPVEAFDTVAAEYLKARNLQPIRVCVLGPPAAGKSLLAQRLARHYKLEYLHAQGLIDANLARLQASAALLTADRELEDDARAQAEDDKQRLDALQAERDANNGRLADATVIEWFQAALRSRACRNHGSEIINIYKFE